MFVYKPTNAINIKIGQNVLLIAGIVAIFSPVAVDGDLVAFGPGPVVVSVFVAGGVDSGIVPGPLVVSAMVVVYVAPPPNSLPGMAVPTPLLVQAGGSTIVLVLGLEASSPA